MVFLREKYSDRRKDGVSKSDEPVKAVVPLSFDLI
jgi:hypothetical protein